MAGRIAVAGAGIYGSTAAIRLTELGHKVDLFDPLGILRAASAINQYRIHSGYHYPRSPETISEILEARAEFIREFDSAIVRSSRHYYAIPRRESRTAPADYETIMAQHGLPLRECRPPWIDFDFIDHVIRMEANDGSREEIKLFSRSVADFYQEFMQRLHSLGVDVTIWTVPVEIAERTPVDQDVTHASYDPEYAHRFWQILAQADRVLKEFRSRFIGKVSPVHFFWGGFDLAVTRFSGRRAPEHGPVPNMAKFIAVEAYSHEVSSCGFWPGVGLGEAQFYAYAYPEPEGFRTYKVQPKEAFYHDQFGEFFLPYSAVRKSSSADKMLLSFFQSTYEAAANQAKWDRTSLEV